MKNLITILFLLISIRLTAQQSNAQKVPLPLPLRQVSGIVQDSAGNTIPNVTVKLVSVKDSIITNSDKNGIFIFDNIKMANFVLTTSMVGFQTMIKKCFNNDQVSQVVLPPVVLKDKSYALKQVNINGTPTIIYKPDTVEYRASDYKVPPYATVDELLKKMEGMEVGADGSLVHNGRLIQQAKLNGKLFSGGDVAQAIQNLPASIVDKIQIIDDYGEQAARTGIKNDAPTPTLNITTRDDRSIGTTATITSQEGNNGRFNERLSALNINANRQISLIGGASSTVNGVASSTSTTAPVNFTRGGQAASGGGRSAPGTTKSGAPTIGYNNTWNNNLTITGSYNYEFNNTNSVSNSYGQGNSILGPSNFKNNSTTTTNNNGHTIKLQAGYNIGKFDFIQITPTFTANTSAENSNSLSNTINYFTTGFEHPVVNLMSNNPTTGYNYGLTALFVHAFRNPKRNFSVQAGFTRTNSQINGDKNADYRYYTDSTENVLVSDSLSHLITLKTSNSKVYRAVITYVEPLSAASKLELVAQVRNANYDNKAISDTVLANGTRQELFRLDNIYNYSFTETKTALDYHHEGKKSNLTLGIGIVPTRLSGNAINNNTGEYVSTTHSDFRAIPVFRYSYSWSSVERLQIAYTGSTNEPNFRQIQPFTDRSDPNNIVIGNPDLRASFNHNINASYNKYFPADKFNISINVNGNLSDNQVTTNIVQTTVPISATLNKTINEINYVNLSGSETIAGAYSITKRFAKSDITLALNGNINYSYNNALSNNILYHTTVRDFNERFGPRFSLSDTKFSINPFIGYETNISATNTLNATTSTIKTLKLAVDGQMYFPAGYQFHYNGSKNFISGITGYNLNPLVINTGIEKGFTYRNQHLTFTFDAFDLLHQNSFIQQYITPQSTTYTQSNTNSRYFLVGLRLNLQHWGGTPVRNGQPMKRRGDGSFIN